MKFTKEERSKCTEILENYLSNFYFVSTHEKVNKKIMQQYNIADRVINSLNDDELSIFCECYVKNSNNIAAGFHVGMSPRKVDYLKNSLIQKTLREYQKEFLR